MNASLGMEPQVFRSEIVLATGRPSAATLIGDAQWRCLDALVENILKGTSLVVVTGEPGSGKSRILNAALARLARQPIRFLRLASTRLQAFSETCIANRLSLAETLDRFVTDLVSETPTAGWYGVDAPDRVCLVVDNAETLGPEALLLMLQLLDAPARKDSTLSIIFVARPEFLPLHEQCAAAGVGSRTVAHLLLSPLSEEAACQYAEHLLQCAGTSVQRVISKTSLRALVRLAQGNPGRINSLVATALEFASGTGKKITTQIVMQAGFIACSGGSFADFEQLLSSRRHIRFRHVPPRPTLAPPPDTASDMPCAGGPGTVAPPQQDVTTGLSVALQRRPRKRFALASVVTATIMIGSIGPLSREPPMTEMPTITAEYAARVRGVVDALAVPLPRQPVVLASTNPNSAVPAAAASQADGTDAAPAATTPASQANATSGAPATAASEPWSAAGVAGSQEIGKLPPATSATATNSVSQPRVKLAQPASRSNPPPVAPSLAPAQQPGSALRASMIAVLLRHGDEMLRIGDIAAARLLFRRAAEAGSAAAAIAIGKTNDPRFLAEIGAQGIVPDPVAAAEWYRRAATLGDRDADRLLRGLKASSAR